MRSSAIRRGRSAALAATATATAMSFILATPAFAQTAQTDEATSDEPSIVVIGTRRTDRTVTDSASPVDVISAAELSSQPTPNMLDAVKNLVPSFFVPQNTISDASTFVRAPSLRGLPADNILVMLNGKRFNRSPLVQVYTGGDTALSFGSQGSDISSIPSIAVGNLQILRDGATAQYGSDAIGGVLNYGLRKDSGIELQALYGQHFDSYGPKTPYGNNGRTYQISGDVGFKLGDSGFINVAGEFSDSRGTSRGETRASAVQFATNFPALASQLPNYPGPVQIWGSSPSHGYKFVVNSEFDVGENSQLYFFGNLAHTKADQSFNYRLSVTQAGLQAFNGTSNITVSDGANSAFSHPVYLTPCPAASSCAGSGNFVKSNLAGTAQTFNFSSLYPAGFTPRFVGVNDQIYGVVGFRGGDASAIKYDASVSASKQQLDLSMYSSLSPSYGPQSQTEFEFGKLIQREINANLDLSHELDAGFASPLTISGGLEFRRETYEATEGDVQSYAAGPYAVQRLYVETAPGVYAFDSQVSMPPGASGYGGTSPTFAGSSSENSYGGYLGLEGDLTERFSMGIAARYEHYQSFGDAFVGKLNGLWKVTDNISLRGTVGTGFHAPSPGQNNVQILTTTFVNGDQVQVGTYPVTSSIAQYFGATTLGPERSTNYGAGIVLKPLNNLSLTVDAYSIKVKNRIGLSQTFNVTAADLAARPELAGVGVGGSVQYFTNGFDTVTRGIDVVGSYRTDLAGGKLNLTAAYNYNRSKVTRFDPGVIGVTQLIDIKYLAPAHRANFSANWQMGDFALNLREAYYGEWRVSNDYPIREGNLAGGAIIDGQHFGAKWITDLDVSYTFMDHYTLTVGANNLFNTYPDRIAATVNNRIYALTNATQNGSVYPRSGGPFGINGGFWYARLRVKY
ncbi:TonB-dependent siderophore receptor [Novosphingobium sp.]|uniref:TonB-dependent receptor plug domain-containing protein n=1 Tax=Novosphingobium sp. TaxID=1874826 RepID=UPI0025F5CA6A|nr:TonB-dependent receptor [Novosphingobium sp.]